jgi:hypothetical protein
MKPRYFPILAGVVMGLGLSMPGYCAETVSQSAEKTAVGRPNLVFIFSDQRSFDMHCSMTSNTSGQGRVMGRPEGVLVGKIE